MIISRKIVMLGNFWASSTLKKRQQLLLAYDGARVTWIMDFVEGMITTISVFAIVLLVLYLMSYFLGPKAHAFLRSNREEKIGLSKDKLFNANGYLVSWRSDRQDYSKFSLPINFRFILAQKFYLDLLVASRDLSL